LIGKNISRVLYYCRSFCTAIYLSNYFGNKKIDQLKSIQDKISIDILSSETQFSLLSELSCKNISDSVFSSELGELGVSLSGVRKIWAQPRGLLLKKILFSLAD